MKNPAPTFAARIGMACNAVADRCFAYALATNIAPMPKEGEWMPMPEYGDMDYWATEDGRPKKYIQRFTPELAAKMKLRLQAVHAKEGADFRGLPIYAGHPPADRKQWPDERRLGDILEIDPDPKRARVRIALNKRGRENQQEGYLVYPSPGWNYSEEEARRTGLIMPDELDHIGMTNMPRMTTAKPWTNSEPPFSPAGGNPKTNNTNTTMDHKKMLLKLLGLPDDASDETITAAHGKACATNSKPKPLALAINGKTFALETVGEVPAGIEEEIKSLAVNAAALPTVQVELDTARKSVVNANTVADKFRGLAINAHLDRGIDKALITAAERPAFAEEFAKDYDAALLKLNGKGTALNTKPLEKLAPVDGADLSTPQGRKLAFNARTEELMKPGADGKRISLDQAIAKMRATPADAAILKAMEEAK